MGVRICVYCGESYGGRGGRGQIAKVLSSNFCYCMKCFRYHGPKEYNRCIACKNIGVIAHREIPGKGWCNDCWKKYPASWKVCSRGCGPQPISLRTPTGPVCKKCYDRDLARAKRKKKQQKIVSVH